MPEGELAVGLVGRAALLDGAMDGLGRSQAVLGSSDDEQRAIEGLECDAVIGPAPRARDGDAVGAREDVQQDLEARPLEGLAEKLFEAEVLDVARTPAADG